MSADTGELGGDAYRVLFQSNPRPQLVMDWETLAFVAVNDAACALYGWSRDELLSMNAVDLRIPEERELFERFIDERRRGVPRRDASTRGWHHRTKSERVLQVDLEIVPLVLDGRSVRLLNITDITNAPLAERRFRLLVEHSADGIGIVDDQNIIRYVSPAIERILGFAPQEVVGHQAEFLTHPDDLEGWESPEPGKTASVVARSRHRDGTWRWIETTMTNLTNEASVRGRVANFRDVTERKETERTILETQRRLEYVLSATSAVMYTARASGDMGTTFVSSNIEVVTGHPASVFLASPTLWFELIHPDDRKVLDDAVATLMQRGEHSFHYRFRCADGQYRWLQDAARVALDVDGQSKHVVGYLTDITERTLAEQALRRSEANFRILIERSPTAIFVHRRGRIVYANSAIVTMLGYGSPSELVGRELLELVEPGDHDIVRGRMARTLRDGAASPVEARMIHHDGRLLVVEAQGVLLDFDGEPSSVVLASDVTERREMFARIAVADRMLSVGTLAAGVAHEINNPLAYVMSNLALLASHLPAILTGGDGGRPRPSPHDIEEMLRDAQEGAARVCGIVRDLRALSRADDETRESVDVAAVLASSMKMAHNELRHRAHVVVEIDDGLPPVHANPSRLGQVFLNLLVNAAQAIPHGHADSNEIRVRVRTSPDAGQVLLDIEDTGAGIPSSVIGRIFDPFFTTKPIGVGTGLGLSICHQIVKSVGGDMSVTSTPGKGSCFRVALPVTTSAKAAGERAGRAPPASAPVVRVLMVDDEPALGKSTRLLLQPQLDVVPVTRGQDALDRLARGEHFDAILCDLMMPEMSGIELHERLARIAPEYLPRIVFVTGGAFTAEARQFLAAVGNPHIEKPFTEAALRRAISAVTTRTAHEPRTPASPGRPRTPVGHEPRSGG